MTEQIMTKPDKFTVQRPFGPQLADIMISDDIHSAFVKMTDELIEDKKTKSHGSSLAGIIEKELKIYKSDMENAGVDRFMESCVNSYVKHCFQQIEHIDPEAKVVVQSEINSAWVVSQYENEYNPAHNHNGCEISGVLYLKIPNVKGRRNIESKVNKEELDGDIQFIYNASSIRDGDILDGGTKIIKPQDKLMVMFPSYLLHTVYPFIGDGERRCVAFNASYRVLQELGTNEENKPIYNWVAGNKEGVPQNYFYREKKSL